jgi:hypothetical protein
VAVVLGVNGVFVVAVSTIVSQPAYSPIWKSRNALFSELAEDTQVLPSLLLAIRTPVGLH